MTKPLYNQQYYEEIGPGSLSSAGEMIPVVRSFIQPKSVVDVGCGIGTWLAVWEENGVHDVWGVDGDYINPAQLKIDPAKFSAANLEKTIVAKKKFDLAMSLEVAEHIRPEYAEAFIASLCALSDVVLFSAAIPGQGGVQHLNEQYPDYWMRLFSLQEFTAYDCLRSRVWYNKKIDTCYRQNILFFVNNHAKEKYPEITKHRAAVMPIVHPEHFQKKDEILVSYKNVLRTPFHAAWYFIKRFFQHFYKGK